MDHQVFNGPFTSSMSSLEAEFFSGGHHHVAPSPPWPGLDDDIPAAPASNNAISSGGSGSHRKMNHNAYERDSRKQLNEHYSNLRSLLPDDDHHTRKLSNPTIVSRVIKYIPELQKEVDGLEKKKEQLTRGSCRPRDDTAPIVSATCLNDREIMVQVSLLNTMAGALPMSKCIKVLENQGLCLISSSASAFQNQNRTFYSLHLQRTQRTMSKECSAFCDELEDAVKQKAGLHPQYQ